MNRVRTVVALGLVVAGVSIRAADPRPIVRTATVVPIHIDSVEHVAVNSPAAPLHMEGFKLSMIFQRDGKLCAVINDQFVTVGNVVESARVIDIQPTRVTLESVDFPGSTGVLTTNPKLK